LVVVIEVVILIVRVFGVNIEKFGFGGCSKGFFDLWFIEFGMLINLGVDSPVYFFRGEIVL